MALKLRESGHLRKYKATGHLYRFTGSYYPGRPRHLIDRAGCLFCTEGIADRWSMIISGVQTPANCECDRSRCGQWTQQPSVGPNGRFALYRPGLLAWVDYQNESGPGFQAGHWVVVDGLSIPSEARIKEVNTELERILVHFESAVPYFEKGQTIRDTTNETTAEIAADLEVRSRRPAIAVGSPTAYVPDPCRWQYDATDVTGQFKVYTKTGAPECQAGDLQYTWNVKSFHAFVDVDGFSLECGAYFLADRPGQTDNKVLWVFGGQDFQNGCDAGTVQNQWKALHMGAIAGFDEVGYDGSATVEPECLSDP